MIIYQISGSTPGGVPHKKPERAEGEEEEENGGELNFEILIKVNVNCLFGSDFGS